MKPLLTFGVYKDKQTLTIMKTIALPSKEQRIENTKRLKAWRDAARANESGWDVELFKRYSNAELMNIVNACNFYGGYVDGILIKSMNRNEMISDIMISDQCFDNDEDLREPADEREAIEYIEKYNLNI